MRTSTVVRSVACVAVGLLTVVITVPPTQATPRQELPPTVLPPLPDEVDPVLGAVSPVVWQACNGAGLAVGLIVLAGTLAGVPPEVGVPLNEAIGAASGPVLVTFFEVCQQIPLPEEPPDCETDQLVPLLPSLGRPFPPFALLANELRALDTALQGAGLPLDGALGDAADDLLACAAGQDPAPDPPGEGSDPRPDAAGAPGSGSEGPWSGGPATPGGPLRTGTPAPTTPGGAPAPVGSLPVAEPATASGGSGTGLAMVLLGLAALAALGWLHAGNPRPARAPSPDLAAR